MDLFFVLEKKDCKFMLYVFVMYSHTPSKSRMHVPSVDITRIVQIISNEPEETRAYSNMQFTVAGSLPFRL